MITSLCWLPKGAAKPVPLPAPVTEEELALMRDQAVDMAAGVLEVSERPGRLCHLLLLLLLLLGGCGNCTV